MRVIVALACLAVAAVLPARAATYCVTSSAEMTWSLNAAANDMADSELRIVAGTYVAPAGGWHYWPVPFEYFTNLKITGGWEPGGNCTTQNFDSTLSKLSGASQRRILTIHRGNGNTSTLAIQRLSFVNAFSSSGDDGYNLGLALFVDGLQHTGPVLIEHLIARDNASLNGRYTFVIEAGGTMTMRNNLVADNQAGSGTMGVSVFSNGHSYLVNNTIADNAVLSSPWLTTGLVLTVTGSGKFGYFTNNIVWNNGIGTTDHDFTTNTNVLMIANAVERLTGPVGQGSIAPLTDPPGFDANYRLAPGSMLHDVGVAAPIGGQSIADLAGETRQLGSGTDLGAYETAYVAPPDPPASPDPIFKNGFE